MNPERAPARADRVFFPAALLLALVAVPLKAAHMAGGIAPGALPPFWHGHEMLMGYAYAVVGGYLMTGRSRMAVLTALAAWLAGRVAALQTEPAPLQAAVPLAYPLLLFLLAGLPMARASKAGRNAVFPLLLAGMIAAQGLYALGASRLVAEGERRGLLLAATIILLLLFVMGGRILAAASSGAHRLRGAAPRRYAQHGPEAAGIVALAITGVLDLAGVLSPLSAAASAAAGVLILLRLAGWRAWRLAGVPEVFLLHVGYAFLAIGLLIKAWGQATGAWPPLAASHVAFVGGLGMLSLGVMARVRLQRERRPLRFPATVRLALFLLAAAAVARGAVLLPQAGISALWISAALWGGGVAAMLAFQMSPPPAAKSRGR